MKRHKTKLKLKLEKETLRLLTEVEARAVIGGDVGTSDLNTSSICTASNNSCIAQSCNLGCALV